MRYRIFISEMGGFRDSEKYKFVADFAEEKLAFNYMKYMRDKKRYRTMDIIIKKIDVDPAIDNDEGLIDCVCVDSGEYLVLNGEYLDY